MSFCIFGGKEMKSIFCHPVKPEDFRYALEVGSSAASRKLPINPQERFVLIEISPGETQKICFADIPTNRAGIAIADVFGENKLNFGSIMNRMFILFELIKDQRAVKYTAKDGDSIGVSPSFIDAVATFPLKKFGKINKAEFFAKMDKI